MLSGKYVPPSRRGMSDAQARVAGDSMPDRRQREDTAAIRVSNLSENVQEADLQVSPSSGSFRMLLISNFTCPYNAMFSFLTVTYVLGTVQTVWQYRQNFLGQG